MKYVTNTFTVEIVSDGSDMNMPLRSSEDVWHWAKPLYATLDAENVIWGLLYSKLLASVALIVIFAVSHRQQQLATQALILTASVYGCAALVSVWEALR
jgi:hypothetical protein